MEFKWEMEESEWKRMIDEHKKRIYNGDNFYGGVYVGKLCIEFYHTKDESAWCLYTSVYELGKDTGYGYTRELETPYDLLDNEIIVPDKCSTFEEFKTEVEKRIEKMVYKEDLEEQANVLLADWR